MRYYPLTLSIVLLGCSQNIGSLSIASTQPVEIDKRYQSIGLIEGKSELVTSSSHKMVNIDKAIDNALTLFEADLMTDVTLELTTSTIFMTRRKLTVTGEGWKIKEKYKDGSADQDIIESNKKDEDDFILIDGIRYKKEIANKNSKIKLEGLPFQVGKKVQKDNLKIKYDPYTGDPIY
ncbi:MAG: hypothetical protein CM15mP87_09520 [Candidatus Neomarinimicrobiota bacterium]|nr:MAG: hypothetical protein CM15mP87_09520 [Candidatus Neomarinimicrobiota bacterium]